MSKKAKLIKSAYYISRNAVILQRNKQKNKFSETEAARVFRRVVQAVRYLHSKGIIHRDLKPENILIMDESDDLEVQLGDFNLSKVMEGATSTTTVLGTMGYMAPEIMRSQPYSYSADIWSLGICLFILLGGYPPFPLGDNPMGPTKVKAGKFSFVESKWGHISTEAKDCIRKLLKVNPEDRITLDELSSHPWLMAHAPPGEFADAHETEVVSEEMGSRTSSASLGESHSSLRHELTELLGTMNVSGGGGGEEPECDAVVSAAAELAESVAA